MRFSGLLQAELIGALAALGHTDKLVIADAGLPIPNGVRLIDLAVAPNLPSFIQLCALIGAEMPIESAMIASQFPIKNKPCYTLLQNELQKWEKHSNKTISCVEVDHEVFKHNTKDAKIIVRTGEFTPYANVILTANVPF